NFLQGSFIALMVVAFMITFVTMLGQHFPGYAQSLGFLSTGAVMTSAGMIGNISFKVIIGILADKLGAAKATLTMMAISTIGIVMIIFIKNPFVLIASAFLYGACYSVAAVSLPLLTRYFFDIELYNTVFPYANAIGNIGGAIAMSAIGFVYDIFQSYTIAFLISIGFVAVSFAILLLNMHNKQVRVPHHTS
ncbi:MAG: MFS transporter, partial [bacterium]